MKKITKGMPVVMLKRMVVLPGMLMHFDVEQKEQIAAVEQAMMDNALLITVAQLDETKKDPGLEDVYEAGSMVLIKQMVHMPEDTLRVMVMGIDRARICTMEKQGKYWTATVEIQENSQIKLEKLEKRAMLENLKESVQIYVEENGKIGEKAVSKLMDISNVEMLIDEIAKTLPFTFEEKQEILSIFPIKERYEKMISFLLENIQLARYRQEFQKKLKEKVDKNQKDYLLREQMQVIQEELGEDFLGDVEHYTQMLDELEASTDTKKRIQKEIRRLKALGANSGTEGAVQRNYVETLLAMPWEKKSTDCTDFMKTEKILETEHYGLKKVKERILESLAVRMLREKGDSPILCLVGPPGTGKTSIARSIAKALQKEYVRICLGGVRDEAEIRGHRKTYVGAMPGRIATAMKNAGVKNPLLLLDEIDKVSSDHKGDTASALLEVLDGEQNNKFVDHYVEIPMDLSEVFFVCTANSLSTISRPLLDRMEVIEVSGYTEQEKYQIARKYLLKKQLQKNGLQEKQITIEKKAIETIIQAYTKEAGVRRLERAIGSICRKVAKEALEKAKQEKRSGTPKEQIQEEKVRITTTSLEHYLGKEKYRTEKVNQKAEIGVVRGLAWTSVGGTTLEIEVVDMPGDGKLLLTGKLGTVMKESAQIALSYVRSISEHYGIDKTYFREHDFHVHVPEGATPKDGPSAGITMTTALLSAVTRKKVRADVAMTGEVTLRGRVLPIGGLKEKLLAAKQAKVRVVCVPEENRKDVEELEEEVLDKLEICYVEQVEQVFEQAFQS